MLEQGLHVNGEWVPRPSGIAGGEMLRKGCATQGQTIPSSDVLAISTTVLTGLP